MKEETEEARLGRRRDREGIGRETKRVRGGLAVTYGYRWARTQVNLWDPKKHLVENGKKRGNSGSVSLRRKKENKMEGKYQEETEGTSEFPGVK